MSNSRDLNVSGSRAVIPLAVVSCDFRNAPARHRELLVTDSALRQLLFQSLQRMDGSAGFMVIETCNRVEWIVSGDSPAWLAELLKAQMLSRWCTELADEPIVPDVNLFAGQAAATHLFRVVAGMESLATGEAEIAGQFQRALQTAINEETSSRILNGLGRFAAGMARTATRIGFRAGRTRGVHVLAGHFLSEKIPEFGPGMTVGVAGMGEIGRKTADFLEQSQDLKVLRFNRTVPPENSSGWLPLDQLSAALPDLSALVIATGARTPVFGSAMRPDDDGTPFPLLLDLGIPRQVDLTAPGITSGGYYSVDDLQEVAREESDVALRRQLDTYIEEQVRRFRRYCLEREWVVLLNRTQTRRFEMLGETLEAFIAERFGDSDSALQARLAAAMRELVRGYSGDVFDAVHAALEEYWRSE